MEVAELQRFAFDLACVVNDEAKWRELFARYMERCRETEDDADDKIAGFVYHCLRNAIAMTRAHEREILEA